MSDHQRQVELSKELGFWRRLVKEDWFRDERLNENQPIKKEIIDHLSLRKNKSKVFKIISVGSGPGSDIGFAHSQSLPIDLYLTDELADSYNNILKDAGIELKNKTLHIKGEDLSQYFPADSFDLVYSVNALDHCADPINAIKAMIEVLKPGRKLIIELWEREATTEKGHGIHQWDFYEKNSELWIQDFHTKDEFNISEMIQEKYKSSIVNLMKHCGAFLNGDHNRSHCPRLRLMVNKAKTKQKKFYKYLGKWNNEWARTKPSGVVYVPKERTVVDIGSLSDGDNEHLYMLKFKKSFHLAIWTQSTREGWGDNHIVCSSSVDGKSFSEPRLVAGPRKGDKECQASWAFPVVNTSGRIYLFYNQEVDLGKGQMSGHDHANLKIIFSDDYGFHWKDAGTVKIPKTDIDSSLESVPSSCIVWQKPIVLDEDNHIVGFTSDISEERLQYTPSGWWDGSCVSRLMKIKSLNKNPSSNIEISFLPSGNSYISAPHYRHESGAMSSEPWLTLLPNGSIFMHSRSFHGHLWFSISEDNGETWGECKPLRYKDGGKLIKHTFSPAPLFKLRDNSFLLLFSNNEGTNGEISIRDEKWKSNYLNYTRSKIFVSRAKYCGAESNQQPLFFGKPCLLLDSENVIFGPKKTAETGTYCHLTDEGKGYNLWYPDRKFFLLRKFISNEFIESLL